MPQCACRGTSSLLYLRWCSVVRGQISGKVQNLGRKTVRVYTELCLGSIARILRRQPISPFVGRVDGQGGEYRSFD